MVPIGGAGLHHFTGVGKGAGWCWGVGGGAGGVQGGADLVICLDKRCDTEISKLL